MPSPLRVLLPLLSVAALVSAASQGQVPVVNGVYGGVTNSTTSPRPSALAKVEAKAKAGSVRITENSGVCETTEGVYTASGYVDVADDKSIWFWYFAARNEPDTAPLALWFNGGPGSSSMIGLFQELGPCRIKNDSSDVELNPWSWNTNANLLFIDQPVGVGFSHGTTEVGTSQEAAADIWTFMQTFLRNETFSELANRSLAIWTESYGGHYGPTFAAHFLDQNDAIANGTVEGIPLNLQVLGVGDGLTEPLSQYPGYIEYAASNPYHQLVDNATIAAAKESWSESGGCKSQIEACYDNGSDDVCSSAQDFCNNNILSPLGGNWDVYYVRTENPDPYPADFTTYIDSVARTIGAESTWQFTNYDVYSNFAATGDWMRNSGIDLAKVVNAGVRTLVYCGDADYILNYPGIEAMLDNLGTKFSDDWASQELSPYVVNGEETGLYKNAGTLSYLRVYGAGHEVPAYTWGDLEVGEAAFQMFTQIMSDASLSST
ncbi:serine carboxypeptidase [Cylindrobasidium torrendii FP15055 ss-10]|uniref:Carboxypeptidase n=1 Tax=Cylindrobasidium torrendii FP15055 ss-10 TaxID=1314674 RepID=A0A0D7B057_9AGAR|nr:serine carboxypeptidase [Cylindrobasidium torrendii FP15055 ss-10]